MIAQEIILASRQLVGPCIIHYAVVRDRMRLLLKSLMAGPRPELLSHVLYAKVLFFVHVHPAAASFCGVAAATALWFFWIFPAITQPPIAKWLIEIERTWGSSSPE